MPERTVRDFEDRSGGEKDQQPNQDESELEPVVSGFGGEVGLEAFAARHPPHGDEAYGGGDAADEDERATPTPACAGVVGEVTDNGIGECVPKPRDDHNGAKPERAEAERDVAEQAHQLAGNVEDGDGDEAAHAVGDELAPGDTVFGSPFRAARGSTSN